MELSWPLVGRDRELAVVTRELSGGGQTAGVVLFGDAGVGKTRLGREALAVVARRGAHVLWVKATASARRTPFGCVAHLLPAGPMHPATVLSRTAVTLQAAAGPRGVVLGVDDAHLLDDGSAALMHHLVTHGSVRLVVTVRRHEAVPDAITALWKDGHLSRLDLGPLASTGSAEMVGAALSGSLEQRSATRLWQITQGNALYLRQLVEGELAAGRLRRRGNSWGWDGAPVLRPELVALIEERMGGLSDGLRRIVELLTLGEPLEVGVLSELADEAAVEEAEHRGLIVTGADHNRLEVTLAHPLFGEAIRLRMPTLRARRLRGELARALARIGSRDALRCAVLALDSDWKPDPFMLVEAAELASIYLDLPLAERLARAACSTGGGFRSAQILGHTLAMQGRGREAAEALADAVGLAESDKDRAGVAAYNAMNLFWTLGRPDDATDLLHRVAASVRDPIRRAALIGFRTGFDVCRGRIADAERDARRVLGEYPNSDFVVPGTALGLAGALALRGRANEAVTVTTAAREATARLGSSWAVSLMAESRYRETQALLLAGRIAEAARVTARSEGRLTSGYHPSSAVDELLDGLVANARGCVDDAQRIFLNGLGQIPDEARRWAVLIRLGLAQAMAMAGDAAGALATLAVAETSSLPQWREIEPELGIVKAWVTAARHASEQAQVLARAAATAARDGGQYGVEVVALQTAVQFGDRTVATRLAELACVVDGPRGPAAAEYAAALAAHDGPRLDAVSARWEDLGAFLLAADAAAHAAAEYQQAGRRGSALVSAGRAHRLAQRCGNPRTPAQQEAIRPPALTRREWEIANLAAGGCSNREIATQLVLSVRTIENHLYRACTKLGVSDRHALTSLLTTSVSA